MIDGINHDSLESLILKALQGGFGVGTRFNVNTKLSESATYKLHGAGVTAEEE